jgi:hypothetical protein
MVACMPFVSNKFCFRPTRTTLSKIQDDEQSRAKEVSAVLTDIIQRYPRQRLTN